MTTPTTPDEFKNMFECPAADVCDLAIHKRVLIMNAFAKEHIAGDWSDDKWDNFIKYMDALANQGVFNDIVDEFKDNFEIEYDECQAKELKDAQDRVKELEKIMDAGDFLCKQDHDEYIEKKYMSTPEGRDKIKKIVDLHSQEKALKIKKLIEEIDDIQTELGNKHGDCVDYNRNGIDEMDTDKQLEEYKKILDDFKKILDDHERVDRVIEMIQLSKYDDVKTVEKYLHELWKK